jgi:DNA modification methylase
MKGLAPECPGAAWSNRPLEILGAFCSDRALQRHGKRDGERQNPWSGAWRRDERARAEGTSGGRLGPVSFVVALLRPSGLLGFPPKIPMRNAAASASPAADSWSMITSDATLSSDRFALFAADAERVLTGLPDGSVDTCLTSPPYWSARDYEHPEQLGLEDDPDDYVERLVNVFTHVKRVLTDTGTAWLNLGDCYLHGCGTVNGKPPETGWRRNKQLSLIPFRVVLSLQEQGWWIRNAIIWHKPNAMPSSVRDRLTSTWEPVFLLTKSEHYYFDLDAIRVPHLTDDEVERRRAERGVTNGKAVGQGELRRWLNSPRHRSSIDGLKTIRRRPNAPRAVELAAYMRRTLEEKGKSIKWVAEQLGLPFERTRHYFRTDTIGSRLPPEETWHRLKELLDLDDTFDDAMAVEVGDNVFRNHPLGRNPGDFWSVALSGTPNVHFATMPVQLAERALRATLPAGGVCLDPYMGLGTTGRAALDLGGRFVGIDVHREYLELFTDANTQADEITTTSR